MRSETTKFIQIKNKQERQLKIRVQLIYLFLNLEVAYKEKHIGCQAYKVNMIVVQ